ncbi:hypothetical protein C8J46_102548 [Sphingomonas sp. PP-F2F-A104-K0414]|nr:hypothetical protein C8J46_102548 [Sphingomonas sp. PP-F2F-A104-K0414]
MKTIMILGLLFCGSASSAQFIVTGPNGAAGSTSSLFAAYQGVVPSAPDYGLASDGATPTMKRQREERARQVYAMFPQLQDEMAGHSPARARYMYAKAEHQAIWANIRAKEAAD